MEATEQQIREFLKEPKTLAIVGASTKEHKAGYYVPEFMMKRGWSIIPINPFTDEILGQKTVDDLQNLSKPVDGVIIYRNAEAATKEAKKAISKGIPWVWLPEGVRSEEAKSLAEDIQYVEDKCPKALIQRWIREGTFS
jgi:predicted CoA-binding protein